MELGEEKEQMVLNDNFYVFLVWQQPKTQQ